MTDVTENRGQAEEELRAGAVRAVADGEAGHEDLQQERGEREVELVRGEKPRRCPSRLPGRAGS